MSVPYLRLVVTNRAKSPAERVDVAAETMLATAPLLRAAARNLRRSATALYHEADRLLETTPLFAAAKHRLLGEAARARTIARDASETEQKIRDITACAARA